MQFDEGARYADFNASTDKTAEYGLAGLVAAGAGLAVAEEGRPDRYPAPSSSRRDWSSCLRLERRYSLDEEEVLLRRRRDDAEGTGCPG